LSEIADYYEITTERVRQIRASALNRLKSLLEGKDNLFN
jgi:DNA-directed RNA polymerase sigma subunit (sigma70/sigma32)